MKVTRDEAVALAMLATVGATACDSGLLEETRKRFETKFGARLTNQTLKSAINKIGDLLSGSEEVEIDGRNQNDGDRSRL